MKWFLVKFSLWFIIFNPAFIHIWSPDSLLIEFDVSLSFLPSSLVLHINWMYHSIYFCFSFLVLSYVLAPCFMLNSACFSSQIYLAVRKLNKHFLPTLFIWSAKFWHLLLLFSRWILIVLIKSVLAFLWQLLLADSVFSILRKYLSGVWILLTILPVLFI